MSPAAGRVAHIASVARFVRVARAALIVPTATVALAASAAVAQEPAAPADATRPVTEAAVREVLATSNVESILGGVADDVLNTVLGASPTADPARVEAAIRTFFSPDSLLADVVRHVREAADPARFDELRGWLLSDDIRALHARSDSAADAEPLAAYARRLDEEPPPRDAIERAVRFTAAQDAGEFYVRYLTTLRDATLAIARAAGAEVPEDLGLTPAERAEAVRQYAQLSIVSFLQRLEPLSRAEAQRLIDAYESRSGAWYVGAYATAVAAAIERAGRRAADALADPATPGA